MMFNYVYDDRSSFYWWLAYFNFVDLKIEQPVQPLFLLV